MNALRFQASDGKEYTLEFNRATVADAEDSGLRLDNIDDKMMNNIPILFHYAFKMHHPSITKEETDHILFEEFHGLTADELKQLIELYSEPYGSLINIEGEEKNLRRVKILK